MSLVKKLTDKQNFSRFECIYCMNISELARRLNVAPNALRDKLPELGFDIGKRAIKIDNILAQRVTQAWKLMEREEMKRKRAELKKKAAEQKEKTESIGEQKRVELPSVITVDDFAARLGMPVTKLITVLMQNGVMAALNERIDFETAAIIAEDLGFFVDRDLTGADTPREDQKKQKLEHALLAQKQESLVQRPPVVVVMGHVDHGKTTLLDAIRETDVVATESGGITQHIGAYQVHIKGRQITFIDTPGHEAFSMMRVRGGQVADVAVLVVAADDGIMPQTLESLSVIQRAGIPFIVAINKVDKEGADTDRIKQQLTELNLLPEDWGGKVVCALISAKKKIGIDELLETILLVADLEELKADPTAPACGTVVEARVDKGEGPVATILVHTGTLRVGTNVVVGNAYGKIKSMIDYRGDRVLEAPPSMPVKIIGLKTSASVGDICEEVAHLRHIKKQRDFRIHIDEDTSSPRHHKETIDDNDEKRVVKEYPVILRADVIGSLEAIISSLSKLNDPSVRVKVIHQGLGDFTESDVKQASDLGADLLGFNVTVSQAGKDVLSSLEHRIEPHQFSVIYELLDFVKEKLEALLDPEEIEHVMARAVIVALFKNVGKDMIIGGRVEDGTLEQQMIVRVMRGREYIGEGKVVELQMGKQPVPQVKSGSEFGAKIRIDCEVQEKDILVGYSIEIRKRTLSL